MDLVSGQEGHRAMATTLIVLGLLLLSGGALMVLGSFAWAVLHTPIAPPNMITFIGLIVVVLAQPCILIAVVIDAWPH